jgi:glycosyltransferase involved in cell wall biosynthesis
VTCNNFYIVPKEIRIFEPDVCLIADTTANCFWGAIINRSTIPYVSYCSVPTLLRERIYNGIGFKRRLKQLVWENMRNWMWKSYKGASKVLVVSYSTKDCLVQEEPDVAEKIDIVPRSINDEFFKRPVKAYDIMKIRKKIGINESDFVLLSVSRLFKQKGIGDVIKALNILEDGLLKKIKYIVIGEGPDCGYFKNLANVLNLQKNVIFLGAVDHIELINYYDLCDIFLLPTRRGVKESFGRVFVEAAARNKASIAAIDGGVIDVIEDGKTGFLVKVGDIDAICERIKYVESNKIVLKQLGNYAREKAEKHYTSKTVAVSIEKYLKNAILETHFCKERVSYMNNTKNNLT